MKNNPQSPLSQIEDLVFAYSKERTFLAEKLAELDVELRTVKRRKIASIKSTASQAANLLAELRSTVEAHPELFEKPKTITLHGIKVGFQKGKGSLVWDDNDKTVALIRKHLEDQADVLIITEEKPSAEALRNLPAKQLEKIGVRIENTSDQVIVKASDSEIDKLVAKILEEGAKDLEAAA